MRLDRWPVIVLFLLCALLGARLASGATPPPEFQEANRLYEQGKFPEAISGYRKLLHGPVSAALLYNLGNAYFKNGELGQAIYYYRKAELLTPRDPDIQANLRFAQDRVSGSASVLEPVWHRVAGYFRVNELAVSSALFLWILIGLLIAVRLRPTLRATLRPYLLLSATFLAVNILFLLASRNAAREEIAVAPQNQLPIHLGPLTESQSAYTVSDGTELRIENRRETWLQVSDRSGRTGWVEAKQVLTLP